MSKSGLKKQKKNFFFKFFSRLLVTKLELLICFIFPPTAKFCTLHYECPTYNYLHTYLFAFSWRVLYLTASSARSLMN